MSELLFLDAELHDGTKFRVFEDETFDPPEVKDKLLTWHEADGILRYRDLTFPIDFAVNGVPVCPLDNETHVVFREKTPADDERERQRRVRAFEKRCAEFAEVLSGGPRSR